MEQPLAKQVALITGGASGIGKATVRALAESGARVAVVDRDADNARRVASEVEQAGGEARLYVVDLSDLAALYDLVAAVISDFGRIDILINAAGIGGAATTLDFSDQLWDQVMAVNLRAPMVLTREVGKHMVERGGGGRIVNISSTSAFKAQTAVVYGASKAAINGLTRNAAADLGPHDVNVNAVAPGLTKTPLTRQMGFTDDAAYQKAAESAMYGNLLQRAAEPEDVANVIRFLCLPDSRQITGQIIHTSAGQIV